MNTQMLTNSGVTAPIPVHFEFSSAAALHVPPTVIVNVGNVGTSTAFVYAIQATADDVTAPGYDPSTGCWGNLFSYPGSGLGQSSIAYPLTSFVRAVRLNAFSLTAGSVSIQVGQAS